MDVVREAGAWDGADGVGGGWPAGGTSMIHRICKLQHLRSSTMVRMRADLVLSSVVSHTSHAAAQNGLVSCIRSFVEDVYDATRSVCSALQRSRFFAGTDTYYTVARVVEKLHQCIQLRSPTAFSRVMNPSVIR